MREANRQAGDGGRASGAPSLLLLGALPGAMRRRTWAGPAYGLVVWLGFELGIAPVLGQTFGLDGVSAALDGLHKPSPTEAVAVLRTRVADFAFGARTDDLCLLAARIPKPARMAAGIVRSSRWAQRPWS